MAICFMCFSEAVHFGLSMVTDLFPLELSICYILAPPVVLLGPSIFVLLRAIHFVLPKGLWQIQELRVGAIAPLGSAPAQGYKFLLSTAIDPSISFI